MITPTMRSLMTLVDGTDPETWEEAVDPSTGQLVLRTPEGNPPTYLYRIMSRAEYAAPQKAGHFIHHRGERIHAANRLVSKYLDGDCVAVRFRYHAEDGWRPKWGDELYAATDGPVPVDHAELVNMP